MPDPSERRIFWEHFQHNQALKNLLDDLLVEMSESHDSVRGIATVEDLRRKQGVVEGITMVRDLFTQKTLKNEATTTPNS